MNLDKINANNKAYARASEDQKETIKRVQTEFLNQIQEGKSEKEAFKLSLKAIDKKYNPKADELVQDRCDENVKLGERNNVVYSEINITPENVIRWLDVVSYAIPIIEGFVDWCINRFAPSKSETGENLEQANPVNSFA